MGTSEPRRARVGYLTVHPGLELKNDKNRLNHEIEGLIEEARRRVARAGFAMDSEPMAMVVEGTAIALDDPRAMVDYTWGPSVGIFVEVHVRSPLAVDADDEL